MSRRYYPNLTRLDRFGCVIGGIAAAPVCLPYLHRIPSVVGADAPVGPPLDRYGSRGFVAASCRTIRTTSSAGSAPHDVDPAAFLATLK